MLNIYMDKLTKTSQVLRKVDVKIFHFIDEEARVW